MLINYADPNSQTYNIITSDFNEEQKKMFRMVYNLLRGKIIIAHNYIGTSESDESHITIHNSWLYRLVTFKIQTKNMVYLSGSYKYHKYSFCGKTPCDQMTHVVNAFENIQQLDKSCTNGIIALNALYFSNRDNKIFHEMKPNVASAINALNTNDKIITLCIVLRALETISLNVDRFNDLNTDDFNLDQI